MIESDQTVTAGGVTLVFKRGQVIEATDGVLTALGANVRTLTSNAGASGNRDTYGETWGVSNSNGI